MRVSLRGYYQPTEEEFADLWKKGVFAFDASVLLDLYRSTAKTRKVLLGILERIKDRIWVPYQAAWEYQENRLGVISTERAVYVDLKHSLKSHANSFKQEMQNHAIENADAITAELAKAAQKIEEIIEQSAKDHPDLMTSDEIRDQITVLFEGRVGSEYGEKRIGEIHTAGVKRYDQKIPPGYEDAKKGGTRQYGDLVVWNEMLDYAKGKACPVVFITSDSKGDWWWKQGQFTIGPRPELVQEMLTVAQQRFYMYNVERFLEEAERHLDTRVERKDVKEAAEEFKEIEKKRTILGTPFDAIQIEQNLRHLYELKDRLIRLSPSQWSTIAAADLIDAAKLSLGRPLDPRETNYIAGVLQQPTIMNGIANTCENCWEIAEFLSAVFREAVIQGVYSLQPQ